MHGVLVIDHERAQPSTAAQMISLNSAAGACEWVVFSGGAKSILMAWLVVASPASTETSGTTVMGSPESPGGCMAIETCHLGLRTPERCVIMPCERLHDIAVLAHTILVYVQGCGCTAGWLASCPASVLAMHTLAEKV